MFIYICNYTNVRLQLEKYFMKERYQYSAKLKMKV